MYGQTGSGKTYTMMGGINNSNLISIASQLSPRRGLNDYQHVSQSVNATNLKDCISGGDNNPIKSILLLKIM